MTELVTNLRYTFFTKYQGLPEVAVFRGLPRFDLAEVKTPADPAGVGVKIFSGVKSSPGSG